MPEQNLGPSFTPVRVTATGSVFTQSEAAPAGTGAIERGRWIEVFRSRRTSSGWVTRDLTAFGSAPPGSNRLLTTSADGSAILIETGLTLSPEDVDNPEGNPTYGRDLYVVREGEAPQLVTHGEIPNANVSVPTVDGGGEVFANPDLTAVGFVSPQDSLQTPESGFTVSTGCYMWDDVETHLAYLTNPEGPEPSPGVLEHQNCRYFAIAADGRAIIEETAASGQGLMYASVGGGGAGLPSRWLQNGGTALLSGETPGAATFDALSPDGETVYLTTIDQLQEDLVRYTTGPANVYAVNLASPTGLSLEPPQAPAVTCISCGHSGAAGATYAGQSADGSHVFFTSSEGLWSWSAATGAQLVAPVADDLSSLVFSANGQHVIALSSVALSSADTNAEPDVYEVSESEGFVPRLITSGVSRADVYTPAAVSNSGGQVLYEDKPGGEPTVIDEWVDGQTGQISPLGATHAYSVDGTAGDELEDVVFEAHEPLVAQDENAGTVDIYDARIDGGFPAPTEPVNESQTPNPTAPLAPAYTANLTPSSPQLAELPVDTSHPAAATKPLTRAQKLAKALKSCKQHKSKSRRTKCEKQARQRYGPKAKTKSKTKAAKKAGR